MPKGKFVNHKGRSRNFTSPEELQQQADESTEESSSDEEGAAGSSKSKPKASTKGKASKHVDSSESDDDSEEESSEDDRDAKKGVSSLIEIENPNRVSKKAAQKVTSLEEADKPELTRREREQIEKQKAKLRYDKLHAEGKTSQAKADLARLAIIKQQRADAVAKREAEKQERDKKDSGKA